MLNSCLPLKRFWTVRNDENMGQQPDASEAESNGKWNRTLFRSAIFSEILKGQGSQDKLDELESFSAASDFHQKLVADKTSGVWFVNFSEDGKVSFNPPGWSF